MRQTFIVVAIAGVASADQFWEQGQQNGEYGYYDDHHPVNQSDLNESEDGFSYHEPVLRDLLHATYGDHHADTLTHGGYHGDAWSHDGHHDSAWAPYAHHGDDWALGHHAYGD